MTLEANAASDENRYVPQAGVTHSTRLRNLDIVRGLAVLLVMAHHLPKPFEGAFGVVSIEGGRGVDLFFCLSGFLIGHTVISRASKGRSSIHNFRDFVALRTVRIWPLYFAVLSALAVGGAWVNSTATLNLRAIYQYYVFFFSNYIQQDSLELGVLWSLAVEEHFYAVVAVAVVLFSAERRKLMTAFVALAAVLVTMAIVYRALLAASHPDGDSFFIVRYYFSTPSRIDQLALGLATAVVFARRASAGRPEGWTSDGRHVMRLLALLLLVVLLMPNQHTFEFSLLGGAICVILYLLAAYPEPPQGQGSGAFIVQDRLFFVPLRHVGKVSYGCYLFHPMTRYALERAHVDTQFVSGAGVLAAPLYYLVWCLVTVAIATITYFAAEQPLLAWTRRKLFTSTPVIAAGESAVAAQPH